MNAHAHYYLFPIHPYLSPRSGRFRVIVRVTDDKKSLADWRGFFSLCWHYLSSRQVTLQVLSAQMSLTSVFGMGTGGPSSQSIPTMSDGFAPSLLCQNLSQVLTALSLALGDPYRIRTDVKGVRGLCLNHLTNGPLVHLHGLEPGTH